MATSSPVAKKQKFFSKANVLMVGTGEYTTGYVGGQAADSDKGAGVVALTMFDLRRRGKVGRVGMCGVNVRGRSLGRTEARPPLNGAKHGIDSHHLVFDNAGQKVPWYPRTHAKMHWRCVCRDGFDL